MAPGAVPRERWISVGGADLYAREVGGGRSVVVLHGGPDFDHSYLLPELDLLSSVCRLIYYDQRGRGRSAPGVEATDVTLESEMEDLDAVRRSFELDTLVLLGHSWGCNLALEYALRHPERISGLILMNPAPASTQDQAASKTYRRERFPNDVEHLEGISSTPLFEQGDPDTVAAYYQVFFSQGIKRPDHVERLVARLRASFTSEAILKGRAINSRLTDETWESEDGYDLTPRLARLNIPTLVVSGRHDFLPQECAEHIAKAIPLARLLILNGSGHFSYLETPDEVQHAVQDFFTAARSCRKPVEP